MQQPQSQPHSNSGASRSTPEDKTIEILAFMRARYPRFSLRHTLFTSQHSMLKHSANIFMTGGGALHLMDIWWTKCKHDAGFQDWVVGCGASVCAKECSWLSDRASEGPHYEDAQFLRVSPKDLTVSMVESFRMRDLTDRYERTTPRLQAFLRTVIGKESDGEEEASSGRNMDDVRV